MEKFFEERKNMVVDFLKSYLILKNLEEVSEDEDICDKLENVQKLTPKNAFNPFLATGQIRLLSQTDEITYIVLLRRWEDDSYVVVPFSHFATPATDEELKTHYDGGMFMQVLQIWNIRTLRDSSLRQSWLICNLNTQDCQDAWRLWEYTLGGKELSDDILKRTALPIYKSQDPRLQYKQEALANFAKLDTMDSASSKYNYTTTLWSKTNRDFAMAAEDEEFNPGGISKINIKYKNIFMRVAIVTFIAIFIFTLSSLYLDNDFLTDKNNIEKSTNFRGGSGTTSPIISSPKKELGPIGYLVDIQGEIVIIRDGKKELVKTTGEILYLEDKLEFLEEAKAKIAYEDAIFDVQYPYSYKISLSSILQVDANKKVTQINSPLHFRGTNDKLHAEKNIIVPPKMLIAQLTPPITRANKNLIDIYSPRGIVYKSQPTIIIAGKKDIIYRIQILNINGSLVGKQIPTYGNTSIPWENFSSTPMENNEMYYIEIIHNGKIVNNIEHSRFWLNDKKDSLQIQQLEELIKNVKTKETKLFLKFNLLFMHSCYAEARVIAEQLTKEEPENELYKKLLKVCNNKLNINNNNTKD